MKIISFILSIIDFYIERKKVKRLSLIMLLFLLAGSSVFAGEEARYKSELMIKGYEFNNDGLSEAIIKKDKEAVELFVKANININIPDTEGYSALDRAIETGNKETRDIISFAGGETKKRIQEPVTVNKKPDEKEEAAAEEKGSTEEIRQKEKSELNEGDIQNTENQEKIYNSEKEEAVIKKYGNTSEDIEYLCELINQNKLDEVAIMAEGINLNVLTKEGLSPLHYAVYNDNAPMVHLLLNLGSNVNLRTDEGMTPLDIAVLNGERIVARELLENGGGLSAVVAKELKSIGCPMSHDTIFDIYDVSYDDILKYMNKIQDKIN